jgi:hypothetical protein
MELVDVNPMTGRQTYVETCRQTGDTIIRDFYDRRYAKAAVESAKNLADVQPDRCGDQVLVATIPVEVQLEWLDKHGIWYLDPNHKDGVKRLLNSNEYRYLRVKNIIL